ncbi:J domain-containing protein [Nocardioides cynanchi]|uniref:J domain-containing protein n=1 Tax=Nocardioides cynanchi TaxID=2558918 RepID=UPI00124949CC|nr:DnaJ domain-containing protein [Nocardioides cynanchi]
MTTDLYDVLDVEPTASPDEIRAAWRASVADLDPTDRRFRLYNQAAEVLLDPVRRAEYDAAALAEVEARATRAADLDPAAEPLPYVVPAPAGAADRESARPQREVPGWLLVALAALTAIALAVVGVALSQPSEASVTTDTTAAQAAAERAVVPILSYDAHHLDQSQAAATPYLTQDYRTQYDKLFSVIRDNAPRTGTVVRAKYLASGIVRSGAGRVDVLVFVNQVTYNKQHPTTPVIYKNQATVTMEKVGNDWLVDNMVTSQQGS